MTLFRSHGKLSFGRLMDEHGDIQLMFHRDKCEYSKNKKDSKETILLIDAVYFSINQKDKD
ncbi:hypothetical protein GW750_01580 [bacterium]|nr:hypothetical protein [bacterium]